MKMKSISRLLGICCAIAFVYSQGVAAAPPAHEFTLDSADGKVSLSDFRGKIAVLYFGYTSCPDICPTSLLRISAAYKSLDEVHQKQIQPIFISLDPERDSTAKMATYLDYFLPNFVGLTGTPEEIAEVAKRYRINYRKTEVESGLGYVVDHASIYFVIGRDGHLFSHLLHDVTPDEIAESLTQALSEQSPDVDLKVSDAVIRATPPGFNVTAAYFKLENTSGANLSLVGASSKLADKVEIHEHTFSEGMMKMRRVQQLAIAAGETAWFKPGGHHLMFFGLKRPVNPGDLVEVTLKFDSGQMQLVDFTSQIIY